jgi:hypothetical protein
LLSAANMKIAIQNRRAIAVAAVAIALSPCLAPSVLANSAHSNLTVSAIVLGKCEFHLEPHLTAPDGYAPAVSAVTLTARCSGQNLAASVDSASIAVNGHAPAPEVAFDPTSAGRDAIVVTVNF